jgi:flagellar biogenesis protein FliO
MLSYNSSNSKSSANFLTSEIKMKQSLESIKLKLAIALVLVGIFIYRRFIRPVKQSQKEFGKKFE